jgi:hypothetical protein
MLNLYIHTHIRRLLMVMYLSFLSILSRVWRDFIRGLDLQLDLFNSYRSVTTINYNRFTNSHTLQFTKAHT